MQAKIEWPLTVFYDHSCLLCRSEMHNIKARDHADVLRLVDASDGVALAQCAPGQSPQALMALLHARDAAGVWYIGIDAFVVIYGATDMTWVARMLSWPVVKPLAKALYPSVARNRNRYRLPSRWLAGLFERSRQRAGARWQQAQQAQQAHADWQGQRCKAGVCGPQGHDMTAQASDVQAHGVQAAGVQVTDPEAADRRLADGLGARPVNHKPHPFE